MGMSASQARFLELTARRSDIEYQAQQICFERLRLADQASAVSAVYNEKMSNTKLVYNYNNGTGNVKVDLSYSNYKNFMNQQMEGLVTTSKKMFLVSSSGNKIIVANEDEMYEMIKNNVRRIPVNEDDETETTAVDTQPIANEGQDNDLTSADSDKKEIKYITVPMFDTSNFIIADDLDKVDNFQQAIKDGIYMFATYDDEEKRFLTFGTSADETGILSEELDTSDDAKAEAEYQSAMQDIQSKDKKLELEINRLETEREAITTEIDSVKKVIDDNIESTYKMLG